MELQDEELRDLYWSPNVINVIKLRRMRWVRHVARMVYRQNSLNNDPNSFLTLLILATKDSTNAVFVDICAALLGCYAASSGNFLATFRDNLLVPSACCVITQKSAVVICFAAEA